MKKRYLYFMRPQGMAGPIKIGCSNIPARRLIGLSVWSPFPLEIITVAPGDIALEQNVHDCFADLHLHHEWFEAAPRLLRAVEAIRRGTPVAEAIDLTDRRGNMRAAYYSRRSENRRRTEAAA